MSIPYPGLTGNKLGGVAIGANRLDATLISSRNRVTFFTAYNAIPNIQGANLQPGSEQMGINFYLLNGSNSCRAWEIFETQKVVAC